MGRLERLLTFRRARTYAAVFVGVYVVAWCYVVAYGSPPLSAADEPIGGDYIAFHTAGRLLLTGYGAELYDRPVVTAVQAELLRGLAPGFYDAFRNPPFFALLFVPLAQLDLLPGFAIWALVGLACLALSLWLIIDELPWIKPRWRGLVLLVLAFAPVYFGLIDGENATIALLLYVLIYRAMVRDQNGRAGAWAALGLFKPQLFFVFPLIFLATRRWRALAAYALVGVALAVVSLALVGPDGLQAWLRILFEAESGNAAANAWRMASLKSFFDLLLPGQWFLALALYLLSSVVLVAVLLRAWRRSTLSRPLLWAFTSLVALLVDPHLVDYDMTVLVLAGILVATTEKNLTWLMLVLFVLLPFRPHVPIGAASLQLTTIVLGACAYVVWRQGGDAPRPTASASQARRFEHVGLH